MRRDSFIEFYSWGGYCDGYINKPIKFNLSELNDKQYAKVENILKRIKTRLKQEMIGGTVGDYFHCIKVGKKEKSLSTLFKGKSFKPIPKAIEEFESFLYEHHYLP